MKNLTTLLILLLFPLLLVAQTRNSSKTSLRSTTGTTSNETELLDLTKLVKKIYTQNTKILQQYQQFLELYMASIEMDNIMLQYYQQPRNIVDFLAPNIFWGSDSTGRVLTESNKRLSYNIIIHDTVQGFGLPPLFNLIVDPNNSWVTAYLTEAEITILTHCEANMATTPRGYRKGVFYEALHIILRGKARQDGLLIGDPLGWEQR